MKPGTFTLFGLLIGAAWSFAPGAAANASNIVHHPPTHRAAVLPEGTGPAAAPTAEPLPTATPPAQSAPASTGPAPVDSTRQPEEPRRRRRLLGINAGIFVPTSSKTRSRFGDSWLSVGVGFGAIHVPSLKGRVRFHYSFSYRSHGTNHALIVPLGVQYRRALSKGPAGRLYAGASADLVVTNLRSAEDNISSGLRTAPGGSIFLGTSLGNSVSLEGRYQAVGQVRGLDLSGFSVGLGVRF